jgi:FkbM family methyltransferase
MSTSTAGSKHLWWHPHQRLWNWALVARLKELPGGSFVQRAAIRALIELDSLLLVVQVLPLLPRRLRFLRNRGAAPKVLYIDCGVHKRGEQVLKVHEWLAETCELSILGFEANPASYEEAVANLGHLPELDLRQIALVGPDVEAPTATLHVGTGDGKGDSLFAERGNASVEVPAARLSAILNEDYPWFQDHVVLLRMNIEGAELFVVEDLVAAHLTSSIDAYFGMWDDLSKIDPDKDVAFRQLLRSHDVSTLTFNDRDMTFAMRLWAVRVAMEAAIARA